MVLVSLSPAISLDPTYFSKPLEVPSAFLHLLLFQEPQVPLAPGILVGSSETKY